MIPAIIAPGFIVPSRSRSARELWASWDGSLDGEFTDITTYGGNPGSLGSIHSIFYDPDLDRGVVRESGAVALLQMFRLASPLAAERLGNSILYNPSDDPFVDGDGDFASSDNRIWLTHRIDGSPDTFNARFAEYDSSGLTQMGGVTAGVFSEGNNSVARSIVTNLDSTRALWSYQSLNGMRVAILQRSGGTLLTTVNNALFGASISFTDLEGARPLRSDRSIVVFAASGGPPWTFDVQGVSHSGTTPSAQGSASTITTNGGAAGSFRPFGRLSRCLDGFGSGTGRFVFGWDDDTNSDIQLRCIQYDGSSLSLGATLDTGIPSGPFEFVTLGQGALALIHQADPTSGAGGFRIIEYDETDVGDLTLTMSAIGLGQVSKDGFATGHTISGAQGFRISSNRFGLAVANGFDGSVNVKVVSNGGDSFI